jgi:predicted nucleic acid-binding protein
MATIDPPTIVVDASVVIKWLIPEDDQPKALEIRDSYQEARMNVVAPGLLTAEIGNVLWKRVRSGLLSSAEAEKALFRFQQDTPILRDSPVINASALRLAVAHNRTFYDSLYLAVAIHHQCDLVTADEKFVRAMAPAFPAVRLLKSYVPPAQLES